MTHSLHIRADGSPGGTAPVAVTPSSAGWDYAGLTVLELAAGEERSFRTGSAEMVVLPLSGSCTVECDQHHFELSGRRDVFSRVSDFAYIPIDSEVHVSSLEGGRFALPSAQATRRLDPAYGPAEEVPVELRGAGKATRQLNNFCAPTSFATDKLMAVECITPEGNWSSYPPHKHDECHAGEAVLEEIYYFEVGRIGMGAEHHMGEGFAFHRLYTADGDIDLCEQVGHGDVVLVPRGYHGPSMTAPGYDLYHLNVLAGPAETRTMAFCDDPAHGWVRESWKSQEVDPRLPLTSASGARPRP